MRNGAQVSVMPSCALTSSKAPGELSLWREVTTHGPNLVALQTWVHESPASPNTHPEEACADRTHAAAASTTASMRPMKTAQARLTPPSRSRLASPRQTITSVHVPIQHREGVRLHWSDPLFLDMVCGLWVVADTRPQSTGGASDEPPAQAHAHHHHPAKHIVFPLCGCLLRSWRAFG